MLFIDPTLTGYLDALVPQVHVALVEAVYLALVGYLDVFVRQDKLPDRGVQREPVHSSADAEYQDGGGAVQAVTGTGQVLARLADVHDALLDKLVGVVVSIHWTLFAGLIDPPYGSDRDSGVDVGRAVEGVEANNVVAWGE